MIIEELKSAVSEALEADLFDLTHVEDDDLLDDLDFDKLEIADDPYTDYLEGQIFLDDYYPF